MEKLTYCHTNLKMVEATMTMGSLKQVNVDTLWSSMKDMPCSTNNAVDHNEEMIFADLYRKLTSIDVRETRVQRRDKEVPIRGHGKGLTIRHASTTFRGGQRDEACTSRQPQTYRRTKSIPSYDALEKEPHFDDEGNRISEEESLASSTYEMTTSDSIDDASFHDHIDDESDAHGSTSDFEV
ncbi:hypothetical protein KP509_16G039700 [Ceratopteris richardii]|uniref:Uncharacterized protein n=1 Tax=Ceratopteris richardii TaxID=49495 RepID=A0A8T2T3V6_CERRI|nr:hypothetical protein KP509_16G039700 [Ceratopteris richardii]